MFSHSILRNSLSAIDRTWKSTAFITLGTVCLVAGTGNAQASTVVDTTPYPWGGGSGIGTESDFYGTLLGAALGQTFTAPTNGDNVLSSFSIGRLEPFGSTVKLRALVMGWDGAKPTGSVLYKSDVRSLASQGGHQTLTFNPVEVSLSAGSQYVTFLTSVFDLDGNPDGTGFDFVWNDGSDAYSGGRLVYFNQASNLNDLTTQNWQIFDLNETADLSFTAEFTSGATAVPTPALLPGLLGLGLGVLRKRKAAQAQETAK